MGIISPVPAQVLMLVTQRYKNGFITGTYWISTGFSRGEPVMEP
jgi:hypothetical protein